MRQRSLAQDLFEATRVAAAGDEAATAAEKLAALEHEHQVLSGQRRRLHESIDMLEGLGTIRPDAAARLEKYKLNEANVSRSRARLYREIAELRFEQLRLGERR